MKDRALDAAMRHVAAQGVTTVHNMGTWDDLDVLHAAGRRPPRDPHLLGRTLEHMGETSRCRPGQTLWPGRTRRCVAAVGMLKGFVDGSLGSHTAAFNEPFTDAPGDRGLFVNTPEDLYRWIQVPTRQGCTSPCTRSVIARIRTLLDIFERVARENGTRDRRFRIEHAQHLAPADIPRFGAMRRHPEHAALPCDRRWPLGRKGDRPRARRTTYAFRSLLDARARSPSAATGSSHLRRRSKGSMRR